MRSSGTSGLDSRASGSVRRSMPQWRRGAWWVRASQCASGRVERAVPKQSRGCPVCSSSSRATSPTSSGPQASSRVCRSKADSPKPASISSRALAPGMVSAPLGQPRARGLRVAAGHEGPHDVELGDDEVALRLGGGRRDRALGGGARDLVAARRLVSSSLTAVVTAGSPRGRRRCRRSSVGTLSAPSTITRTSHVPAVSSLRATSSRVTGASAAGTGPKLAPTSGGSSGCPPESRPKETVARCPSRRGGVTGTRTRVAVVVTGPAVGSHHDGQSRRPVGHPLRGAGDGVGRLQAEHLHGVHPGRHLGR